MKTKLWIGVMVLLAVAAGPVVAGGAACTGKQNAAQEASNVAKAEKEHGCTADTQYCLNKMAAKLRDKGWVGVELDDADGAMTITRVEPYSPALAAGLQRGDVLLAVNNVSFGSEDENAWHDVKSQMQVGKTITYTIKRDSAKRKVDVTLAEIPDEIMAKWVGRHMLEHAKPIELAQN